MIADERFEQAAVASPAALRVRLETRHTQADSMGLVTGKKRVAAKGDAMPSIACRFYAAIIAARWSHLRHRLI